MITCSTLQSVLREIKVIYINCPHHITLFMPHHQVETSIFFFCLNKYILLQIQCKKMKMSWLIFLWKNRCAIRKLPLPLYSRRFRMLILKVNIICTKELNFQKGLLHYPQMLLSLCKHCAFCPIFKINHRIPLHLLLKTPTL